MSVRSVYPINQGHTLQLKLQPAPKKTKVSSLEESCKFTVRKQDENSGLCFNYIKR